jgi:hypothetical protein
VRNAVTHGNTKANSNEPHAQTVETKHEHQTPLETVLPSNASIPKPQEDPNFEMLKKYLES